MQPKYVRSYVIRCHAAEKRATEAALPENASGLSSLLIVMDVAADPARTPFIVADVGRILLHIALVRADVFVVVVNVAAVALNVATIVLEVGAFFCSISLVAVFAVLAQFLLI